MTPYLSCPGLCRHCLQTGFVDRDPGGESFECLRDLSEWIETDDHGLGWVPGAWTTECPGFEEVEEYVPVY